MGYSCAARFTRMSTTIRIISRRAYARSITQCKSSIASLAARAIASIAIISNISTKCALICWRIQIASWITGTWSSRLELEGIHTISTNCCTTAGFTVWDCCRALLACSWKVLGGWARAISWWFQCKWIFAESAVRTTRARLAICNCWRAFIANIRLLILSWSTRCACVAASTWVTESAIRGICALTTVWNG